LEAVSWRTDSAEARVLMEVVRLWRREAVEASMLSRSVSVRVCGGEAGLGVRFEGAGGCVMER
jgi:hypothetical protein